MWFARDRAFSLVEVTIAVGIAGFVLVSLVGLMAVGLGASRRASEDTTVAALAGTVFADLLSGDYTSNTAGPTDRYFDFGGARKLTPSEAHFRCRVETFPHDSASFLPDLPSDAAKGVRVRLSFYWPIDNPRPEEVFETTIARH